MKKVRKTTSTDGYCRCYYLGPDDWEAGLQHGKIYKVKAEEMKSGRISVEIEPENYHLKIRRHKYADMEEFEMNWKRSG